MSPGATPAGDHRRVALCQRDSDGARFHRLVGLHDINESSLRPAQNGGRGTHGAILARFQQEIDIHELVGPKLIVFVIENAPLA